MALICPASACLFYFCQSDAMLHAVTRCSTNTPFCPRLYAERQTINLHLIGALLPPVVVQPNAAAVPGLQVRRPSFTLPAYMVIGNVPARPTVLSKP